VGRGQQLHEGEFAEQTLTAAATAANGIAINKITLFAALSPIYVQMR